VSGNALGRINEVNPWWAWLVLGWVTVCYLFPTLTKNWTVCQRISLLAHSWLFLLL